MSVRNRAWRIAGDRSGTTAVAMAVALPVLLAVAMAAVEFSLVVLDYHRAGEATRRGARLAAILPPVANLDSLKTGGTVTCGAVNGAASCTGGGIAAAGTLDDMLSEMTAALPTINPAEVKLTYSASGLGSDETPGGIMPLVEVSLSGTRHDFAVLGRLVPGLGDGLDLPAFSTSMLASGAAAMSPRTSTASSARPESASDKPRLLRRATLSGEVVSPSRYNAWASAWRPS